MTCDNCRQTLGATWIQVEAFTDESMQIHLYCHRCAFICFDDDLILDVMLDGQRETTLDLYQTRQQTRCTIEQNHMIEIEEVYA